MKRHLNLLPRWGSRYLLAYGRAWKGVLHTWSMRQESWTVANQSKRMLCNAVHCARFLWRDSCAVLCFQALDEMILLQDRDAVLGSEEELHEQGPDLVFVFLLANLCNLVNFWYWFPPGVGQHEIWRPRPLLNEAHKRAATALRELYGQLWKRYINSKCAPVCVCALVIFSA